MKLIVVSAEVSSKNELELVRQMIDSGLYRFHLRRKSWDLSRTQRFLVEVGEDYQSKISVHGPSRWRDKLYGAKLHLRDGEELTSAGNSKSFHTLFDVENEIHSLEYGFISPVFDSVSKPGYLSNFQKSDLKKFLSQFSRFELFALGGVQLENLTELKAIGFKGAAVLGAVWFAEDPLEYFKRLQEKCLELH